MRFVSDDIRDDYTDIVKHILKYGEVHAPRGQATRELLDVSIQLHNPMRALPIGIGRGLNMKIAAVEAAQLIGGVCDPTAMLNASSAFKQYMDGGTFHGGYGQRTRGQIPIAIKRLRGDPHSRQAVVTLWDPLHDLFTDGMKDYPCTVALQFMIRGDKLLMHTHMRSNDVWRGLAYDLFVFTQLQQVIASDLSLRAGTYYHHVSSLHLYETDVPLVESMIDAYEESTPNATVYETGALTKRGTPYSTAAEIARLLLSKEFSHTHDAYVHVTEEMAQWYSKQLS